MKPVPIRMQLRSQSGFTLIEVLVAILICSVGLMGIVGLRARAVQYSVGSEDTNRAMLLAEEIAWAMQDLKTTSLPSNIYTAWLNRVKDPKYGFVYGSGEVSQPDANGVVTITIKWSPPGAASSAAAHKYVTEVAVPL